MERVKHWKKKILDSCWSHRSDSPRRLGNRLVVFTTSAFVTDVVTEAMPIGAKGKEAMSSCAPDNFWTLLGSLVEMGGFFLLGIILIPMLLGWFLPGPVKLKGRDKKPTNPYLR